MDVMELVENEPNARPFQCDWQTCNKVRLQSLWRLGLNVS